ncbi:MAG: immunoglobulin domain-containing protein [Acidobacteria bacterium]|nr:immunoglobulin domain-containing protein [Acidobacteriota bacterium]MBS1864998.1 immunoglobulin domain-containing protein [Acidobacteriota bacterium]
MASRQALSKTILAVLAVILAGCAGVVSSNPTGGTPEMPAIAAQPTSQTVTAGQAATFGVTANGTAPLNYQWRKNSANINGATTATYTTPATTSSDNGTKFDVVVSNAKGSVTSSPATLVVNATVVAPAITTQPASQTVTAGQPATFTVAATGTAPLAYQWQKNGSTISGATASTYTTPATTTGDSGSSYTVAVTNSKGSVTSAAAILTVKAAVATPAITTQPSSQTVTAGQTATFMVAATGTAPLSYQWKKNGANISGATNSTYTTPATTTGDSGSSFAVAISNAGGSATSNAAILTVNSAPVAPTVTTQPANRTVTAGQTATFSVVAGGTTPLSYQWKKNGTAISGASSSTYTTPATTTADSGAVFNVTISNTAGSVTSGPATLTVNASAVAPTIVTQPLSTTVTAGQTATFVVVAAGTAPLTYQWQKNGANLSGGTASYTTPATSTSDNGSTFVVTVSNSQGSVTSSVATLTVNPAQVIAPTITTGPASQSVVAGQTATFSVAATGTAPLTYQWLKNNTNISGANGANYTTPATSTTDNGTTYTVTVTNSAGNATSNAATLTVTAGSQKTYSTTFPLTEGVISESGNWINGKANGVDWKDVSTIPGLAYGTENGSTMYDDSTAVLTGTWNTNQMAQATVHTVNQNSSIFEEVELRLRTSITANSITGYEFNFRCTSDGSQYAQIVRWNGPLSSFTLLDSRAGPGLHDGDVIKATAKGNTLTIYLNGTALFSVTDSTFANGSPGIGFYNQNGTTGNNKDYGFTSFSAADNI